MVTANFSLDYISELELESIQNYAIKECFEIITDEVEFFFQSKVQLIDVFVEGIDFSKLSPKYLQERFYKVFYPENGLENFLAKIEKRVHRELNRASIETDLNFKRSKTMELLKLQDDFYFIFEAARTYTLSCNTARAVNKVWRKNSKCFIPKALGKLSMEFNPGDYILSTVGLTPGDIKKSISERLSRSLRGILKNNKNELNNLLRNEIISQILKVESKQPALVDKDITKTA